MRIKLASLVAAVLGSLALAPGIRADVAVPVTVDNFVRAETDLYFSTIALKEGGFGKFHHNRDVTDVDHQTVIRTNRDTYYSAAVFDLDAGPVTVTMPDPGRRFMSMMVINEDHYVPNVFYGKGTHTLTKDAIGTRYVLAAVRTLVDPTNPEDVSAAHALQDAIQTAQAGSGRFEVPAWDPVSQKKVREALLALGSTMPDFKHAFGRKGDVDPVRHLVASAAAWGGNPDRDATYLNVVPARNDGKTPYRLVVKDVPVDGFWSISVYNAKGYFQKNPRDAYTINNITAKKGGDESVAVQFGGTPDGASNYLPITPGWNYTVRLYRPRNVILDGAWTFPEPKPVN